MEQSLIKKNPQFDNHELVSFFFDKETGLRGIIAIHSTKLGPAVGGTRYFPYNSDEEALEDVLRLSRSMSYKCILAGVKYGGGKCVLIAPSQNKIKAKEYLEAYGRILKEYSTKFFTGEDVGMSQNDIEILGKITPNIIGTKAKAGDPSPWAALSTYYAIRGALKFLYGDTSLKGKKIIIKGLGKVGMELARLANEEGAILLVSDVDKKRTDQALKSFKNVSVIAPSEFSSHECDIFAPCALGKDITDYIAQKIEVKIICGAANNQLVSEKEGVTLFKRGVVYVPDYVANGGGLINVVAELSNGGYNKENVLQKCKNIEDEVVTILKESKETDTAPSEIADRIAKRALEQ
ncbi:MAG: Glu/Leu/Phe/Val dehydrogenase [Patescibacteria group bacterium]|nr:Glu/Leu/Phe/Val dehydrogenase [Patescibacteria group bacterium]